jgi:hypothetical protein
MNTPRLRLVSNSNPPEAPKARRSTDRAVNRLLQFIEGERQGGRVPGDFREFEKHVHGMMQEIEREVVAEAIERADVDAEAIRVGDHVYHRTLRSTQTYQTAAGEVTVERWLYRDRSATRVNDKSIAPVDLRIGMIDGRWSPLAAEQASWVVAQMTPALGEQLFERLGNMTPSKSSLDRLPKKLEERWDSQRAELEDALRSGEAVPSDAAVVAISLDGVLAPMKDGERAGKREEAAERGQLTKGPAGYREVGVGTLSFYDRRGTFLRAVRLGRMPEPKKETLKRMLLLELGSVLGARPEIKIVKLADGAADNWEFLDELPWDAEAVLVDFFHATEHMSAAFGAAYGDGSIAARNQFDVWRRMLLEDDTGADKVIRALARLAKKHPRNRTIAKSLGYFRNHRHRMRYAQAHRRHLPVGSGVVEAACKTLVSQRMKLSGMLWGHGGQAILDLRSWHQSDRFDHAWVLLSATYKAEVTTIGCAA